MEIGRCPDCDLPYSAREVAGLGILRARPARDGGPVVEYRCAGCDRTISLVPHGEGRYAPPGAPVPEPVPAEQRVPPWAGATARESKASRERGSPEEAPRAKAPAEKGGPPPRSARGTSPPGSREPGQPAPEVVPAPESAMTLLEALEVLGVPPTADRAAIERAYRDRSVQCHPDKVAHLDAEFQALAEKKFRRVRAAYDLLMG